MQPTNFQGANDVLGAPKGITDEECGAMIMHRGIDPELRNYPVITSCWEPSQEEKEEFIKTGKIYLRIWDHTTPMLSLSVFNPVEHGWVKDGKPVQPDHPLLKKES